MQISSNSASSHMNAVQIQAPESSNASSGLSSLVKSIWEKILSCLKCLFCCEKKDSNLIKQSSHPKQQKNITVLDPSRQQQVPRSDSEISSDAFGTEPSSSRKEIIFNNGTLSIVSQRDVVQPDSVWEPDDAEALETPMNKSVGGHTEDLFTGVMGSIMPLAKLAFTVASKDKMLEDVKNGEIKNTLEVLKNMQNGPQKDSFLLQVFDKFDKKNVNEFIDFLDCFHDSANKILALEIVACKIGSANYNRSDVNDIRMKAGRKLFEYEEYQSAAKIIKPVPAGYLRKKELAMELGPFVL